jgi:hypothetical protein
VFKAQGGGQLRISNFRRNLWRPAVADANLEGLRIHDLRHTAVALWIAAGASPKEVAARAGHTSVSFVLDRYGHLFPEADTALRARLDGLFRAATEHRRNTVAQNANTLSLIGFGRPGLGGSSGAPPGTRTPNRCLKREIQEDKLTTEDGE